MRLEMKHLLPYLPYGLKAMVGNIEKDVLMHQNYSNNYQIWFMILLGDAQVVAKPLLRPLDELTKEEIGAIGYSNLELLKSNIQFGFHLRYKDVEYLVSKHFDVFGLIDKGLAVEEKIKEKD